MKIEITVSNGKAYVIEHDDKESILRIVSQEVNKGFYYKCVDTVCDPKVKYGKPDKINGTDLFRDGYISIGYATYYVSGKGNICDNDITVYLKSKEVFDLFGNMYDQAKNASSVNERNDIEHVLPNFDAELQNDKYGTCKEREDMLNEAKIAFEN